MEFDNKYCANFMMMGDGRVIYFWREKPSLYCRAAGTGRYSLHL
jgi:hypothetical protein